MIDHLIFVRRSRRQEHDQIVPLPPLGLGHCLADDLAEANVVDDHLRIVLLAPFLDVVLNEPLVVGSLWDDFHLRILRVFCCALARPGMMLGATPAARAADPAVLSKLSTRYDRPHELAPGCGCLL